MQKLKKLSLVSSTSKLYIEIDSQIFLKLHKGLHSSAKMNNNIQEIMKKKTEDKSKIIASRGLILCKPLELNVEISKFLTTIPENFSFSSVPICPSFNRIQMKEDKNCTAVVPWLYSSRTLIPYKNKLPNNVNPTKKFESNINLTLDYKPENFEVSNHEIPVPKVDDYTEINPSKFALNLSEIWEEMKEVELQDFPLKSKVTIKISRNCKSCPAVVSIKQFQSKFSPKRAESKVLLLNCDNFSKFETTFTKLLAKNKIRNIQPLLQKMENKEHVLTKLERAFINHNLRINKNKDMLKRNVIVLQPKVMENIKESLGSKDDNEKFNTAENRSTCNLNNINSKTSNVYMGKPTKPSNIMIVNDEIFKEPVENKGCSHIQEEKNNLLYLNNAIFKELKREEVNKILSRTYTNRKESENEIVVMIPTRKSSQKLKPLILTDKKDEEYQEIPLENLIAAVADKKRLEYVERSKINWKVFEEFERTLEKVKILNFPPTVNIQNHERERTDYNEMRRSEISETTTQPKKQKTTLQEKEESKFQEDMRSNSPYSKETIQPKITPKTKKVKEKRINPPHKTITMKEVEHFKIHPHRITLSQSVEKEQIKSVKKGRNKSPTLITKIQDQQSNRSRKEKTTSQNTSKTKRPEKTFHSIVKICVNKNKSKINDNKTNKLKNNKESNEGTFKQKAEVRIVKINKLASGRTMANDVEYNNLEKRESIESSLFPKHRGHTKIKSKHDETSKVSTTKNVISNKNYESKFEGLTKTIKKTSTKENNNDKEKFMNVVEKNSNQLFEEQKNRSFKEQVKKDNSIIFLHKAPIKSTLSSSHFEISEDLVIKPRKKDGKLVKSEKVPLKIKIPSKIPEDVKENKLIVEEPNGSIHSDKIVKTKKPSTRKFKTQLPILGTPTTIAKQIEKIAVTALETNAIKENLNEEIVEGNVNNSALDKPINRRKQKKLKATELKTAASNETRKENYESEEINNLQKRLEKMKNDARNLLKMVEEEKRLDIDEILAMSSPSLAKRSIGNSSKKFNNEHENWNEEFKLELSNQKKISEDNTENKNTAKNITNLPKKYLNDESSPVPQNFEKEESQKEELINKKGVNVESQEKFFINNTQYDLFKGSMDEINDDVELTIIKGTESRENKLESEIFKQKEEDESEQKFESNELKYNPESKVTKQNDFTESIDNKTTTLFNEIENSFAVQQSKTEKNILEEIIENDKLGNCSPDSFGEVFKSKEQLTEKVETEEIENILRFLKYEGEEEQTVEKENKPEKSESNITIYKTKTQEGKGEDYADDIYNRHNAFILDRDDDKESISSLENIASYKDVQKDHLGYELRKSEIGENDSHEQFVIFRGVQQKTSSEERNESEIVNQTKNEETRTSETGESTTKKLVVDAKTEDTFRNNEENEIKENKGFSTQENKATTKSSNQSSLDKTANFSTTTNNQTDEKSNILEEKLKRNSTENFIETYFSENNIEDFDVFKTKLKKTENSDERSEQTTKPDILMNERNEIKKKSTEDPEVIRKKRLIYFGNCMKIKGEVDVTQSEKDSGSKADTAELENQSIKYNKASLQPERLIENSSQTSVSEKDLQNSMIRTNQATEIKLPIEIEETKEKQNSFSQYDNQLHTDRSEKAIETDESDHRDAAVIAKTESLHNGTKPFEIHKILKQSVSDNVIILKAARTDSEETVESVDGITKSFLKRIQSKMNIVQSSKLKTNTMQKCREIIINLKKSQEKIARNIPSKIYKIYQEARKIKSKLSRTKFMKKNSEEIVSKFTNTSPKYTVDTANQAEVKAWYRPESKVRSVIERKVTSRIKFLTKSPIRTKKKKRNMNFKTKSKEGTLQSSPSLSLAELRNRSIGSLFADTVASALAQCGNVNQFMSKYSESVDKIPSDGNTKKSLSVGNSEDLIEEPGEVQKEDEFLMNDGIRKLVLTASVEKNENSASEDEWKCCPKAVLMKKTIEERENQSGLKPSDKYVTNNVSSSSEQNKKQAYLFSSPFDNVCNTKNYHEESQEELSLNAHLNEEANALEETKQDLTKLKMLLQEEKEKTLNNDDEEIVLIKNNEILNLKMYQENNNIPKSLEDLHKDLISGRDSRKADGSTSPPPEDVTDNFIIFQDMNSCESFQGQPTDCSENGRSRTEIDSKADLKESDFIPVCLTDTESMEMNSPEIFVTPLTSNTDFNEDYGSLEHRNISLPQEGKIKAMKRTFDNREASETRMDYLLEETQEDRNEIFIDLKPMGNCTLKTNPSKDKVSIEEPTKSGNPNLKNNSRSFATDNPYGSYSRFKEPKDAKNNESKKEKYDLEELDKLHDEALDDEIFFGREIKRRKKDSNTPRRSIYDEIVQRSERIVKEIEESEERHMPVECVEDVSRNPKKIHLDRRSIDDTVVIPSVSPASSSGHNKNQKCLSKSESLVENEANDVCPKEAFDVSEVFKGLKEPELSENEERKQPNSGIEENEKVVFESADECWKGNDKNTENEKLKAEDIEEKQKQTESSGEEKKHKILKKFAQISQEQDSSIFRINNDVKFDLNKKRMCQTENKYTKPKRCISHVPNQAKEENVEKPLMIIKLSPSRELYKPPVPKMSDTDLKNMLVQNPKMLMRIASDIMSKNQYLSFLLDLKSSKELKEYWMNKIKDGIVSSKSFRDLAKVMDYFKGNSVKETDNADEKDLAGKESEAPLESNQFKNEPTGLLSTKSGTDLKENKTNQHGETNEPTVKTSSSKTENKDLLSSKSDTVLNENKTNDHEEKEELRAETRQSSPSSLGRTMLKRDHEQGKNSRRNLRLEHKNREDGQALPYTLEKYLKSPVQTMSQLIDDKSINSPRISKNLHGEEIEMEIAHQKENGIEETILPMKRRVGKYLFKLSEEKPLSISNKQKPCKKIDMMKNINSKIKKEINENIENNSLKDQSRGNNWNGIFNLKKTKSEDFLEKKMNPQQTAIVLPGREPMKISLMSNEVSASPVTSIKDNSEKNVLENLSDVLSNCSSPVSSLNSKHGKLAPKKRIMKKVGFTKTRIEMQQSKTPLPNISKSLQKQPLKPIPDLNPNSLKLKKFDNPLKEFVRNHEDFQPPPTKNQVAKEEDTNFSPTCLYEERQVIRTKSLSEVLKEDPDFLKKIREKKMLDANKAEEAARRFEYRFHDFRRKEDKNLVIKAKRQEEQKRDLLTKFKCLIQARKAAAERNRQNIRSNEKQQIQPKVFSKILEKISYFKELENQPKNEVHVDTVLTDKGAIPTKGVVDPRSPRAPNGNRRMLHTKRKQINEDELVTWVQEHPAVPEKRVAMENSGKCEDEKQNVIHVPWTPTNRQEDT